MARHKSRAFVLSAAEYRETSRLLQLFCENEGRISVIARGVRTAKGGKAHLADAFNLLQVNYTLKDGATLGMLTSVEPEQLYSGLRSNLESYALASYWFEIIKVAAQARIAGHEAFRLTHEFLQSLQNGIAGVDAHGVSISTVRLLLDLTQELGFGMQLHACGECGNTTTLRRFSISAGVAVCEKCQPPPGRAFVITPELSAQLAQFSQDPPTQLSRPATENFLKLYNEFLTTHLDHRLETFKFLMAVNGNS